MMKGKNGPEDIHKEPRGSLIDPRQGCPVDDDDVKPRINELLFPLVPGSMRIYDFEVLACDVYDLVLKARHK